MMETKIQKTCSLKLELPDEDRRKWLHYFNEFSNAVNGYVTEILRIRNNYRYLRKNEQYSDTCDVCQEKTTIEHVSKDGSEKYCRRCFNKNFGDSTLRKKLYPARGRKVNYRHNIRNYASITGTEWAMAYYDAMAILKSAAKKQRTRSRILERINRRLTKFTELRDDKTKRVKKEREERERVDRYAHTTDLEKGFNRYYSFSEIRRNIETLEWQKKTREKRQSQKPRFAGKSMTLHKNNLKIGGDDIDIKIGKEWYKIPIIGEYQKNLLQNTLSSKTYPHISNKKGTFFLEYPLTFTVKVPTPDKSFRAMGIDRGVNKILVHAVLDSSNGTPHDVRFFKGKELIHKKWIYEGIRKKLHKKRVRNVNRKIRKTGGRIRNITNYLSHNISRAVVNEAKKHKPVVIVLEDIKYIRDTGKKGKTKARQKPMNRILSNFIYLKIQKFIIYKAAIEEIPVAMVNPAFTSQMCNKCGTVSPKSRKNQSEFHCVKCGYNVNADYNASVNIARKFYTELDKKELVFEDKENIFKFQEKK